MYTKKERQEYNIYREKICQCLGITKNQFNWLRRKGAELQQLFIKDCNGELNLNCDNGEYDQFFKPYYRTIDAYCQELKLYVYYQTDPRGATIYIDKKPIPKNNYNQAYCIY